METRLLQMHEIDVMLFTPQKVPRIVTKCHDINGKRTAEFKNLNADQYNSLSRIVKFMYPMPLNPKEIKGGKIEKMKVKDKDFTYQIHTCNYIPLFVYWPTSCEVIQRMILKAIFTKSLDELKLELSQC